MIAERGDAGMREALEQQRIALLDDFKALAALAAELAACGSAELKPTRIVFQSS